LVEKAIPLLLARSALTVILSEVSNANEVEGSRTASRQRSRYRFWGLVSTIAHVADISEHKARDAIRELERRGLLSHRPATLGTVAARTHITRGGSTRADGDAPPETNCATSFTSARMRPIA